MYNALVRALQCHFLAGREIKYAGSLFCPNLKPKMKSKLCSYESRVIGSNVVFKMYHTTLYYFSANLMQIYKGDNLINTIN